MSAAGRVSPLLLATLDPGVRVRADGDVIYATEQLEIADGAEGTVDRPWGVGLSFIRWDVARERAVATSHDSIAVVMKHGSPVRRCPNCQAEPAMASDLPLVACLGCGWTRGRS